MNIDTTMRATEYHLQLVRRTLAAQLDKNNRLEAAINRRAAELIAQSDIIRKLEERLGSVGVNGWQTIECQRVIDAEQATRISELEAENEALLESLDSKGMGMWELVAVKDRAISEYAQIVAELKAEKEDLIAENVRLTGQVHALLATIEAQL